MLLTEQEMLAMLSKAKKVALIEPKYRRKYLPLGLAKISSFVKANGGKISYQREWKDKQKTDLICISSLFTHHSKPVLETIEQVASLNPNVPILVGGVAASLMPKRFDSDKISLFRGTSKILDTCVPDYTLDYGMDENWSKFSFTFTTRGCPNKCAYCAVWRLEPEAGIVPNWKEHIIAEKPYVMISDNNLSAQPMEHIVSLVDHLAQSKKRVIFDNGFDCKHITDDFASLFSRLKYHNYGFRLAFDRIEEDGLFQTAIAKVKSAGVKKSAMMAYVLFNFKDTPKEANYRMAECVKAGVRPYPQQYMPLNAVDGDKYIGKHWTKNLLRAFRIFWLFAGYYSKSDFETWAKNQTQYQLDEVDWECWRSGEAS